MEHSMWQRTKTRPSKRRLRKVLIILNSFWILFLFDIWLLSIGLNMHLFGVNKILMFEVHLLGVFILIHFVLMTAQVMASKLLVRMGFPQFAVDFGNLKIAYVFYFFTLIQCIWMEASRLRGFFSNKARSLNNNYNGGAKNVQYIIRCFFKFIPTGLFTSLVSHTSCSRYLNLTNKCVLITPLLSYWAPVWW